MSQKASSSSLHENNYYSAFLHQLRVNVNEIEEWEGRKFHILPFPQLYSKSRFVFSCCRSWELRQGEESVVLLRLRLRRRIENVPQWFWLFCFYPKYIFENWSALMSSEIFQMFFKHKWEKKIKFQKMIKIFNAIPTLSVLVTRVDSCVNDTRDLRWNMIFH